MGFSVRLAPGVRVRASSRGLRTSVGPRAARLHVGAGRAGVSTGVGPVGYYTSVGGSGRSRTGGATAAGTQRQLAAAAKAEEAQRLVDAVRALESIHRAEFPPATPPQAPAPALVDRAEVRARHRKAALKGIGLFQRRARGEARAQAERSAQTEIADRIQVGIEYQQKGQAELEADWARVLHNDPALVLGVLAAAFEDNDAAAAPVGVNGDEAAVVVLVPSESSLPERLPSVTDAGNLSLRKVTKTQAADLYKVLVCGHVLVTVKEALAIAPGLNAVRVVALRDGGRDSYGQPRVDCVLAAKFTRAAFTGVHWNATASPAIVNDASAELLVKQQGATKAFTALDLSNEPDIQALIAAVDLDQLTRP